MEELIKLPNLGQKLAGQLNEIGVFSYEDLKCLGSKKAWLRIQARDPSVGYLQLGALEGAVRGVKWQLLPEDVKADLKDFYSHAKK